jgi:hypothetical protein
MLAIALGIMISIGTVHFTDRNAVPTDQAEANYSVAGGGGITKLPNPDGRLSRVHLLLSGVK